MRLDLLLVEKKLASSRTLAQELIKNGFVYRLEAEQKNYLLKSNIDVPDDWTRFIFVENNAFQKFVSRGGLKLEAALKHLNIKLEKKIVLDVGQSTGGFTDCLLQNGAQFVVGVDVGRDQLHADLKKNQNMVSIESLHVNALSQNEMFLKHVPKDGFDLIVTDVSFISLTKVMSYLKPFLKPKGHFLFLVKPQFEAGSNALDKNGIVKDEKTYDLVQTIVSEEAGKIFGRVIDFFKSELQGKDGNQEFFIYGQNEI